MKSTTTVHREPDLCKEKNSKFKEIYERVNRESGYNNRYTLVKSLRKMGYANISECKNISEFKPKRYNYCKSLKHSKYDKCKKRKKILDENYKPCLQKYYNKRTKKLKSIIPDIRDRKYILNRIVLFKKFQCKLLPIYQILLKNGCNIKCIQTKYLENVKKINKDIMYYPNIFLDSVLYDNRYNSNYSKIFFMHKGLYNTVVVPFITTIEELVNTIK